MIPGETEEDGMLRREYVLVGDTRAVEFNRAIDGKHLNHSYGGNGLSLVEPEITAQPRRPLQISRIPFPSPAGGANEEAMNTGQTTFPPPPNTNIPPLSSSPSSISTRAASNALNRALSLASKTLFGSPGHPRNPSTQDQSTSVPPSPKRPQIIALDDGDGERDPMEDELLGQLENLAQKTDVLTHWADETYEYVKAIPQSQYLRLPLWELC